MIGLGRDLLRILREQKAAMFGAIVVVIYCLVAIFGPIFVHISNVSHPGRAYQAPSLHHPLGMDPFWYAVGMSEVVEENMANAARVHAIERGQDLQGFTMIAFGGAAPLHAGRLAQKLGIRRVLVPASGAT